MIFFFNNDFSSLPTYLLGTTTKIKKSYISKVNRLTIASKPVYY